MQAKTSLLFRSAGKIAYAGAVVSALGIVFLVALYVGLFTGTESLLMFGPLNDIFVLFQYALALPVAVALHQLLGPDSPRLSLVAMLLGIVGIIGVVVLQFLLIIGVMSFLEQVGFVSAAVLVVGVWIVITGFLGRRTGRLPVSVAVIILAALYFGYPLWAMRVGQQLRSRHSAGIKRIDQDDQSTPERAA